MNGSEKDHELKMADQLRLLAKQISVGFQTTAVWVCICVKLEMMLLLPETPQRELQIMLDCIGRSCRLVFAPMMWF